MPHLSNLQKKRYAVFFAFLIVTFILGLLPGYLHSGSSVVYIGLIIAWGITLRRRIMDQHTKKLLMMMCVLMELLFVLRIARYEMFSIYPRIGMYVWCLYYIPFTAVPLVSLFIARSVYTVSEEKSILYTLFVAVEVFIILLTASNPLHGLVLNITRAGEMDTYTYGISYYMIAAVEIFYTICAFFMLMRRCRIAGVRKYWYIPGIPALFFCCLWRFTW